MSRAHDVQSKRPFPKLSSETAFVMPICAAIAQQYRACIDAAPLINRSYSHRACAFDDTLQHHCEMALP